MNSFFYDIYLFIKIVIISTRLKSVVYSTEIYVALLCYYRYLVNNAFGYRVSGLIRRCSKSPFIITFFCFCFQLGIIMFIGMLIE